MSLRNPDKSDSADEQGCVKYRTIVADPPWQYGKFNNSPQPRKAFRGGPARPLPYPALSVDEICALPVANLAEDDAHLYLWTTGRYLPHAFRVVSAWGFTYAQPLVWCKAPGPLGLGGAFASTTEFVLFARRGMLPHARRISSTWFLWKRQNHHSQKPEAFIDMVEQVSPGPYVELFARRHRLGWDVWGNESANTAELPA